MWVDCAAAVLYGLGLALVLLAHWRHGWRSRRQGAFSVAWKVALLPIAAGACDLLENLGVIFAARVDGQPGAVAVDTWAASLIATVGVTKWVLVWLTLLALTLTLYGVVRFRKLELPIGTSPMPHRWSLPRPTLPWARRCACRAVASARRPSRGARRVSGETG